MRVVGVDYPFARMSTRLDAMQRSADRAFADARPGETMLCLSHHPDFFPFASRKGARLTISGHTHGGQVVLIGSMFARIFFQHVLGWYRDGENKLYVSGGTGHWLPFRIGIPAEVTVLTLKAA
jgi:predicted MPP superfamily phosphohydrolase